MNKDILNQLQEIKTQLKKVQYNNNVFPEINTEKTKANAKRKLREYPRWRRVANDVDGQKITATYTFAVGHTSFIRSMNLSESALSADRWHIMTLCKESELFAFTNSQAVPISK